jgi:hypothetical protein
MALWSMLACESWVGVGCRAFAVRCLRDAMEVYSSTKGFAKVQAHISGLMESLGVLQGGGGEEVVDLQEESAVTRTEAEGQDGIAVEFA